MSEYEQVIDEIVKHGVIINVNKIIDDNYINGERRYVGCVVELDFSEHDKVFEDKIANLEGEITSLKSHMLRLRERCMDDARRHFENGTYGCLTIVNRNGDLELENEKLKQKISDLESLMQKQDEFLEMKNIQIAELKQRIAELESEKTESLDEVPDSITIDGYKCKIIKTESGLYISRDEIYSIIDKEKEPLKQKCKELEDRHQSDCIEINRLNTTIDVLIHKVEYSRQFAELE